MKTQLFSVLLPWLLAASAACAAPGNCPNQGSGSGASPTNTAKPSRTSKQNGAGLTMSKLDSGSLQPATGLSAVSTGLSTDDDWRKLFPTVPSAK